MQKTPQQTGLKKSGMVNYEILDHVYRENTKKYIQIEKFDRGSNLTRAKQTGTLFSTKSSQKMLPEMSTPSGVKQSGDFFRPNLAQSNGKKSDKKESLRLLEGEILSICPPR